MTGENSSRWTSGDAYQLYVGRWSVQVATRFLSWLEVEPGASWLDVGCGTGNLTLSILESFEPARVYGVDRSAAYVRSARDRAGSAPAYFALADGQSLPFASGAFGAAVSGLVLNFVPEPRKMIHEMGRVVARGGKVALYVWDYADKMEMMRYFWDVAARLDPVAAELDEGVRSPVCKRERLQELFEQESLRGVEVQAIDIPTVFASFDDYWSPFLGGQGPAPSYVMSLTEDKREALREELRATLPTARDGTISLVARAWAIKGLRG